MKKDWFIFYFCFFFVSLQENNGKFENRRRRLVGNLLLLNGMIEQLIARNYTVLYAYKARQRLNRLFMISKFIFLYLFFIRFDAISYYFVFTQFVFFFLLISLK